MSGFIINRVVVSGNLTRDPELRATSGGTAVCELGVAVNERFKDRDGQWTDRANFFNAVMFGGIGEWVAHNLHKGDGIVVEGRLRWESWEAQDGSKRTAVKIVADSVVPMPREGQQRSSAASDGHRQERHEQSQQQPVGAGSWAGQDIPFDASGLPGGEDPPF